MGKREVKRRAVFLDRDGVINHAIVRAGKAFSPCTREEFTMGTDVAASISTLKNSGFKVIVVTNQPDIARGKLEQDNLDWMTDKIRKETKVDDIIVCPHDDGDECDCRKPLPGMILHSAEKWGIDLANSYMIGDGWKDMEAGRQAGCRCILIDTAYNKDVDCERRVKTLAQAVQCILKG
ncbi:MAG: HAD-IIIA family hydrolase [Pseudomonadota bacterium]